MSHTLSGICFVSAALAACSPPDPPVVVGAATAAALGTLAVTRATYAANQGAAPGNATRVIGGQCDGKPSCQYTINVKDPLRPAPLFPPAAACASFADVLSTNGFCSYLKQASDAAMMPAPDGCFTPAGVAPANLCPDAIVSRLEMAAYIIRGAFGESFSYPTTPYFTDVPAPYFKYVQKLREQGITSGCTATTFSACLDTAGQPHPEVTRGQMAVFLLRARFANVAGNPAVEPARQIFADVPSQHPFYHYIQQLAALGITSGCGNNNFCPDRSITKGEAATFLTRVFYPDAVAAGLPFAGMANDLEVEYSCGGAAQIAVIGAEADGQLLSLSCGGGLGAVQACLDGTIPGPVENGKTVCVLPPGVSTLDGGAIPGSGWTELHVWRPNTILRGATSGSVLRRGATAAGVDHLIWVDQGAAGSRLENFTVDGNRFAFATGHGLSFAPGCHPLAASTFWDIEIQHDVGPGVALANLSLINSPGTALLVSGSDVSVTGIQIAGARTTGLYATGARPRITGGTIRDCGTAGISILGTGAEITGTQLIRNRHEQPDGVPGGQLYLDIPSTSATVTGVEIDGQDYSVVGPGDIAVTEYGPAAPGGAPVAITTHACPAVVASDSSWQAWGNHLGVDGLEGYGGEHRFVNNHVHNNSNTGMLIKGARHWHLSQDRVEFNGGGIAFLDLYGAPNLGVVLTSTGFAGNRDADLSLSHMALDGTVGGCEGLWSTTGGAPRAVDAGYVDPQYLTSCGVAAADQAAAPVYLGCFADAPSRDLPYFAISAGAVSTESCIAACRTAGYRYAGTQYSSYCLCGNSYGSLGASAACSMACSANASEICGGGWANSVYLATP